MISVGAGTFKMVTTGSDIVRRRAFVGRTTAPQTPSEFLFPVEHGFRFDVERFRLL